MSATFHARSSSWSVTGDIAELSRAAFGEGGFWASDWYPFGGSSTKSFRIQASWRTTWPAKKAAMKYGFGENA